MIAHRINISLLLAAAALLPAAPARAQSAPRPAIVVVPAPGKGPKLDAQLKLLETPLKAQTTVLGLKAYQKTAKKLKVKLKDQGTATSAVAIGKSLKLTHVVLVEGQSSKIGRGKTVNSAKVTLVAIETGEPIFTQTYTLRGKKLTTDVANQIIGDLMPRLIPAPAPATPAPVVEALPTPPPAPPPPPEGPPAPVAAAPAAESVPLPPEGPPPPVAAVPEAPAVTEAAPVVAPAPEPVVAPPPVEKSAKARSWLSARLAAQGFERKGLINDSTGATPVSYSPALNGAGLAQLEFYPLSLGGKGRWYEGLGIDGELGYTRVVSKLQAGGQVTSNVMGGRGGLSLRFVLWDSVSAVDLRLRFGVSYFSFPLSQGSFPSVTYTSPYAGGTLTIPFGRTVALILGGTYSPKVDVVAKGVGTSVDSASSFETEGGLRFSFGKLELGLLGRLEQFTAKFKGPSALTGVSFTDAKLTDKYYGGYAYVGVTL